MSKIVCSKCGTESDRLIVNAENIRRAFVEGIIDYDDKVKGCNFNLKKVQFTNIDEFEYATQSPEIDQLRDILSLKCPKCREDIKEKEFGEFIGHFVFDIVSNVCGTNDGDYFQLRIRKR